MILEVIVAVALSSKAFAAQGEPTCREIADKILKDLNYGSWAHPRTGVKKTPIQDGYLIETPGGGYSDIFKRENFSAIIYIWD